MPEYSYVVRSPGGALANGVVQAPDRAAAIRKVESETGGVPIKLTQAEKKEEKQGIAKKRRVESTETAKPTTPATGSTETLPLAQLFLFTEQLAHLLSAGMTLDEGLAILVKRLQQPQLQSICRALHQGLVDGRSLSQAMRDYPRIFSPLYVNMVSAGEASGALPQILNRLVTHLSAVKTLRDRVQQALVYPAVLVCVGVVLIIVFMVKMVPQLTDFFTSTGQKLPTPTAILLAANSVITRFWWVAVLLGGAGVVFWKQQTRTEEGRLRWDRARWHFPAFGRIPRYRFFTQFARTLATLMENGVPLLKALELLEEIADNEWVRRRMVEARLAVMDGASLSGALREEELFPLLYLDMMAVGEQTGRFPETMEMVANVYERDLDKQVQFVSTVVPMAVIILIAGLVGLIVFGILAAVFNLTSGLHASA